MKGASQAHLGSKKSKVNDSSSGDTEGREPDVAVVDFVDSLGGLAGPVNGNRH